MKTRTKRKVEIETCLPTLGPASLFQFNLHVYFRQKVVFRLLLKTFEYQIHKWCVYEEMIIIKFAQVGTCLLLWDPLCLLPFCPLETKK